MAQRNPCSSLSSYIWHFLGRLSIAANCFVFFLLPSCLVQNVTANHRINDTIANEDGPQTLTGRFMYGPLDMVTLTGEKVPCVLSPCVTIVGQRQRWTVLPCPCWGLLPLCPGQVVLFTLGGASHQEQRLSQRSQPRGQVLFQPLMFGCCPALICEVQRVGAHGGCPCARPVLLGVTQPRCPQVDIHIMTQPPSGEWVYFDTEISNSSGRISYVIPEERRLGIGVYPVKMVVR